MFPYINYIIEKRYSKLSRYYLIEYGRIAELSTLPSLRKYQNQNVILSPLSMNAFQNNKLGEQWFSNNFNF